MDPLKKLWELLTAALIARIESGDCTTQDLAVARQLLKDHGISVDHPETTPIATLHEVMPFLRKGTDDEAKVG